MKVLDLFCGVGGASKGYYDAGYDVLGVDLANQPNYPYTFVQADAFEFLENVDLDRFDLIHASPPCQQFTWATRKDREDKFPNYIPRLREILQRHNYVIENVPTAPLDDPIMLCGTMFSLPLLKHRHFESNFSVPQPVHQKHIYRGVMDGIYVTVAGHGGNNKTGNFGMQVWRDAMDLQWAKTRPELAEAIPPAYTRFIGTAFALTAAPRL